jgi:hypothetical protein
MVLGDPPPKAARIFSTVGREPWRMRESAAWLTSAWRTPRVGGTRRGGGSVASGMLISYTIHIVYVLLCWYY